MYVRKVLTCGLLIPIHPQDEQARRTYAEHGSCANLLCLISMRKWQTHVEDVVPVSQMQTNIYSAYTLCEFVTSIACCRVSCLTSVQQTSYYNKRKLPSTHLAKR
jgi:hypothetical protein